jgi:integral membrane sensor domain MASE1
LSELTILNGIGLVAAIATFLSVWLGHVSVRKIEYHAPKLWPPTVIAVLLGLALELGALLSDNLYVSAVLGIVGITVLFDALEFHRQFKRVKKGHAPANPNNPRHVPLLATGQATTIERLDREPTGRFVGQQEHGV